jgi:hypothetical protein
VNAALLLILAAAAPQAATQRVPPAAPDLSSRPATTAPADPLKKQVVDAIAAGRDWLVAHQNKDGSFGTHDSPRPIEVTASVPSGHEAFQFATSALSVMALDQCARPNEAAAKAASRGIDWMVAHNRVRKYDGSEFYNTWTLGYGLQCYGEWLARHADDPRHDAITGAIREMLDRLPNYQITDGGFAYYDFNVQSIPPSWSSTSFTTATVLVGIDRVQKLGHAAPPHVVEKAVQRLAADQIPEGSFLYGRYLWSRPRMGINLPKGSACRTPGNLYALDCFGKEPKRGAYVEALENLAVKYVGFQQIAVRRPIPHEAWYNISGYFYLYGFYYASVVMAEKLPEAEQQKIFPALARGVLYCRQPDGSFWDYPLYDYHNAYGTSFALLALSRAPKGFLESN